MQAYAVRSWFGGRWHQAHIQAEDASRAAARAGVLWWYCRRIEVNPDGSGWVPIHEYLKQHPPQVG